MSHWENEPQRTKNIDLELQDTSISDISLKMRTYEDTKNNGRTTNGALCSKQTVIMIGTILIYALARVSDSMIKHPFMGFLDTIHTIYSLKIDRIALLCSLWNVGAIFGGLLANWVIIKHGIRVSLILGSILYTIGTGLRCFMNDNYSIVLVGSVIIGLGSPLVMNINPILCMKWFRGSKVVYHVLESLCFHFLRNHSFLAVDSLFFKKAKICRLKL